jgi:hypothetical protein
LCKKEADVPFLGPTRVDGALYGIHAKCEAFYERKYLGFSVP